MDLDEIGVRCSNSSCKTLGKFNSNADFLPVKCHFCRKKFCKDHATSLPPNSLDSGVGHLCSEHPLDARTIVCPICNVIIPKQGKTDPNYLVSKHIAAGCKPPQPIEIYSNLCTFKGCLKKELVPIKCNACGMTFCLRHRLEPDHNCVPKPVSLFNAASNPIVNLQKNLFGGSNNGRKSTRKSTGSRNNGKKNESEGCVIS
jgi:predicted nucleic acid binding AN1-type Zn finger protein